MSYIDVLPVAGANVVGRMRFALERWDLPRHGFHAAQLFSLASFTFMSKGQFIGSFIDAGFWIAAGVYVQFFLARHIQKRVEQGKETPDKAERIKKNGKWIGWLLMLLGVVKLVGILLGHS